MAIAIIFDFWRRTFAPFKKLITVLLNYKVQLAKPKLEDDKYVNYNTNVNDAQHWPPKLVLQVKVINPFSEEKHVNSYHVNAHFVKNLNPVWLACLEGRVIALINDHEGVQIDNWLDLEDTWHFAKDYYHEN